MESRHLFLPVFLTRLFLVNIRSSLAMILHPVLQQRFFILSLVTFGLYLFFWGKWFFTTPLPQTVKSLQLDPQQQIITLTDPQKLSTLRSKLHQFSQTTGHPTRVLANLALINFYQKDQVAYDQWWQQARATDPNSPLFR